MVDFLLIIDTNCYQLKSIIIKPRVLLFYQFKFDQWISWHWFLAFIDWSSLDWLWLSASRRLFNHPSPIQPRILGILTWGRGRRRSPYHNPLPPSTRCVAVVLHHINYVPLSRTVSSSIRRFPKNFRVISISFETSNTTYNLLLTFRLLGTPGHLP